MSRALRIAIVGAESTGKTMLARGLAERIGSQTPIRATWVGEVLREWCDARARTPHPHEQAAIAAEQARRIDAAALAHDLVICDTTPLMTAVYSAMLFDDASLVGGAIEFQRGCDLTLLTALDLPWIADGLQRDGAHVRAPVDARIRALLHEHGIGWHVVAGDGDARVTAAFDAVAPLLRYCSPPEPGG